MHISQNSSAFCSVRCVIARAVKSENCRIRAERSVHVDACGVQMVKDSAAPGDVEETISASVMTTMSKFDENLFCSVAASALLTKCNLFPMPRFRQTCGRKYRMVLWRRSASRPTEQQPIITIQEDGSKKSQPDKTARNFEAALSGQQECFRSRRSDHQQLTKGIDHDYFED